MISFQVTGQILSAESKPYSFAGNEGTSHKIRVLVDGTIYQANSNQEQVKYAQKFLKQDVLVKFVLTAPKENIKLEIDTIEEN